MRVFNLIKNPETITEDSICRDYDADCKGVVCPVRCWLEAPEQGICPMIKQPAHKGEEL